MFIKPYKKLNKRGFTLIELTIVMAITAIISVMIVSFTTLISAQVNKNDLRADFMEQVLTLRTDLQTEFAKVDNGGEITVDNNTPKIDNNELSFNSDSYEYIDDITFEAKGDILKVVAYNEKLDETQSFVLISKVG